MGKRGFPRVVAVVLVMVILSQLGYMVFTWDWRYFLTWLGGTLVLSPSCVRAFRPDLLSPLEAGFISLSGVLLFVFGLAGSRVAEAPLLFGGMFVLLVGGASIC